MSELGYNIVLIRDATLAFETPESLEGEWANVMAITMVEQLWGESTTIDDLRSALEGD
jgi:nicotinamidase-related amidase